MTIQELRAAREQIQREATLLAGTVKNLSQRAATYHHLYQDSGGNHIFPLIASHGALWAKGYFDFGLKLAQWVSWQYIGRPELRARQLESLHVFANAFREINRVVCVDTYTNYHLVKRYGDEPLLSELMDSNILRELRGLHEARRQGIELDDEQKRAIFLAHFLVEQEEIVGPRIEHALEQLSWSFMKAISLKPLISFAYIPRRDLFRFRNFSHVNERIELGLRAFDIAAERGWAFVESQLKAYDLLPAAFHCDSACHFEELRNGLSMPSP